MWKTANNAFCAVILEKSVGGTIVYCGGPRIQSTEYNTLGEHENRITRGINERERQREKEREPMMDLAISLGRV